MAKSSKLTQANALGDDRNLADHGSSDPHYWYSIADGFRLVSWLRREYLDYTNLPVVNVGEEYVAVRENNNKVLVIDPYHTDNWATSVMPSLICLRDLLAIKSVMINLH